MKKELHLAPEDNVKYTLPTASFNLTPEERRAICTFLKGIKVMTGFSSNVKRLV
jgi:predicted secreted Zn-dependent protease